MLMAKKDADESKNKESEETKNKAKEVLKKTNEKYKKLIHGLKARHKEEIASLETSIQAKQEETMKASMLEYENTISELRMNENIAQQKLEKLKGKTKEMEAQVEEAVKSKKKLEDELDAIMSDNSERNEEEGRAKKELDHLKAKNALLEAQIAKHEKDLDAIKSAAADDKKAAMLEQEKVVKSLKDRFEKERGP